MNVVTLQVNNFVDSILNTVTKAGFEIYIVGGAVRDMLVGRYVKDWDFTTNAKPEEILSIFPDSFYNNSFGTVGVIDSSEKNESNTAYEITTFRSEMGYSDGRRPDSVIWGTSLEEDLKRRDFTISAMALKKLNVNKYELIDYHNGEKDIKNKIIRTVGDAYERFSEDSLRMMRAIRIGAQLGYTIEENTLLAISQNNELIKKISWERIRDELFKILSSKYPSQGILLLYSTGLLNYILPELILARGVQQAGHHTEDVWNHSLKSLDACPSKDPIVNFATLIHDIGKPASRAYVCPNCNYYFRHDSNNLIVCPRCNTNSSYRDCVVFHNHEMIGERMADEICQRLRLSTADKDRVVRLVRLHMFSVDEKQTDKAIRRFIKQLGVENINDMLDLRTGDRIGGGARETSWRFERFKKLLIEVQKQPFTVHDLKISGNEVMQILGLNPGPEVGKIMNLLFDEIEDQKIPNEHDQLVERVKSIVL